MCVCHLLTDIKNIITKCYNDFSINLCKSRMDYSVYDDLNTDLKKNAWIDESEFSNEVECEYVLVDNE